MKWLQLILGLLPYVLQTVVSVEQVVGAGNGQTKKQLVLDAIDAGAHVGETVPVENVKIVSTLVDSVVGSLNATGFFKTQPKPVPAPVS